MIHKGYLKIRILNIENLKNTMKKIIYMIFIAIIFTGCGNRNVNTKDNLTIIRLDGDLKFTNKGIKKILKEHGSWFNYLYRQDFSKRRSDNSYLLCYFLSIENIYNSFPNIKTLSYYNDSVRVVLLKIKAIESYNISENLIAPLMDEKMLEDEYLGKNNYGCINILKNIMKQRYDTPEVRYVYMLVLNNELKKIEQNINNFSLNLLQYDFNSIGNLYYDNKSRDTVYSRIYYPYGQYDLSKLESSEQFFRHYDSIDKKVRRKLNLENNNTLNIDN